MIIVRISGGLGNQMFQYAIAKAMAKKNNSNFKLDVSFYPKQTLRKYELNYLNIEEKVACEKECIQLRGKEGLSFKVKKKLKLIVNRPKSYTLERRVTVFDESIWSKSGDVYLDGFWQNENYFLSIKEEILRDFALKEELSSEAKEHMKSIENSQSISLHVRRGDYVKNSHTKSVHGVCGLEYYKKAKEYICNNVEKPKFYVFSDDINWCKDSFGFLENKIFIDNTKSALEDLELMKKCKHNVIANSTFSWWGAWLNANDKNITLSPYQWIVDNPKKLKWVPDNWIQI